MRHAIRFCALFSVLLAATGVAKAEQLDESRSAHAQLAAVERWVSETLNLPQAEDLPRVARVSQAELTRLRYRRMLPGRWRTAGGEDRSQAIGGEYAAPQPQFQRTVVAVYDDTSATIYLPESWTGASAAEESVLVHEMVHHLQNRAGLKYECMGAREKPAYLAQKQWLEEHGLDLEQEFEVDMFTVVAISACME